MGFADSVAGNLFLVRRRSDLEFQIQTIMERKLAVLDDCNEISAMLADAIYDEGQHSVISIAAALPGAVSSYPGVTAGIGSDPTAVYEVELKRLQTLEKELDAKQKKFETELEAVKTEQESMKKIADDHAKKDFKIGS